MFRDYLVEQRYRARSRERDLATLVAIVIMLIAVIASAVMANPSVDTNTYRHQSIGELCKQQGRPDWCREYYEDLAHGRREQGVIPCASDSECARLNPHLPIY